jgi:hypothetical protein
MISKREIGFSHSLVETRLAASHSANQVGKKEHAHPLKEKK